MSAAEALKAARAAGVKVGVDGDDLVLEASAPPPEAILDLLSQHKPSIVALLGLNGTAGRALTGGPISTSGPVSRSSTAVCLESRPRRAPSAAALLNGATAPPCARHPAAALPAAPAITPMIHCYLTAWKAPAMLGCVLAVGQHGTPGARPRLLPP